MSTWTVSGFRAAGIAAGIKPDGIPDLALVVSDEACVAAAVFTQNAFAAAPVIYDRKLMQVAAHSLRAVIINSGNANACTGETGMVHAASMAHIVEDTLGLPKRSTFVMSTGVIGVHLPIERIREGVPQLVTQLRPDGWADAARAIMTTDSFPKMAYSPLPEPLAPAAIGAIAKGAGMIHPHMATMLAVLVTDLPIAQPALQAALSYAVNRSFNRISVDGDMSTNDTVVMLANGQADVEAVESPDDPRYPLFRDALTEVCIQLAQAIVRDGEGATKFVTIRVRGAASDEDAERAARAVANSALCKTAFFGGDPNWGRILGAVGYSGAQIEPERTTLWFTGGEEGEREPLLQVVKGGAPADYREEDAARIFSLPEIDIIIDLGIGDGEAEMWTCDLGYEYVRINAEYRT